MIFDANRRELLYFKIIDKLISENTAYSESQIVELIVQSLYNKLISEQNKRLLQIAFNQQLTQNDLDMFLQNWDIEAAGANRAVLLAYVMKMHPELKFDNYTGPRLQGLLKFTRFQNLELIGHFSKIVNKLNQQGIIPMIIKGGAMRYLRPDLPRIMGDIDILLRSSDEMKVAKQLIQEMGYDYTAAVNSIDLHPKGNPDKGILDIHRFLSFTTKHDQKFHCKLFEQASQQKVFSAQAYVPSVEDMVFICLNNLTHNLRENTSIQGLPIVVFDLIYLINSKPNFDWNIVIQDIMQTGTEASCYIAVKFINKIAANIFPPFLCDNKIMQRKLEDLIYADKFYTLYVHDVKYACKKLRFIKSVCHWSTFKDYIRNKGQHFFTKRIIKSRILTRLCLKIFTPQRSYANNS